jgi:tetratricopeptide (TPR) repeat protein
MLTLEESFGSLVHQLRERLGVARQDMPGEMEKLVHARIARKTLEKIEHEDTARSNAATVELLCRFFYKMKALKSDDDIAWFCFRGGYRLARLNFEGDDLSMKLEPMRMGSFRDVTQLILAHIGAGTVSPKPQPEAIRHGIRALSEMLSSLAPPPPGPVEHLEHRVERLLAAEPPEPDETGIVAELERAYTESPRLDAKFRAAYLNARVAEHEARYEDAVGWSHRAYGLALVVSIDGAPLMKQVLARLCETIAAAELNVGGQDNWVRATELFERAIQLREEMRRDLGLQIKISEEHDLDGMFQIARYYTHVRNMNEADRRYRELLDMPQARGRHWFRAQVYKELADNCRFAEDEAGMRRSFRQALKEYESSERRSYDDPREKAELLLNIGYCHRRLANERRAWQRFNDALDEAFAQRDRRRVAYACLQLSRTPASYDSTDRRALYALAAREMMKRSGAEADAKQADIRLHELTDEFSAAERKHLVQELADSRLGLFLR